MEVKLKYDSNGLIPVIAQEYKTGDVLMLAYMNEESVKKTLETGEMWYWSRSRKELWHKGDTSGHIQKVKELYYDCDADTLLAKIDQIGGIACHTGERSCFYRKLK
jgi:phosphoribosyl-AMP cyclohydrolase